MKVGGDSRTRIQIARNLTSAVILLLEHCWTLDLKEAVLKAGGVLFTGGMVSPEALAQVSAELEAAKAENHA